MTNKARRAILSVGALLTIGAANSRSTYATVEYEPTEADIGYLPGYVCSSSASP